MRKNLLRTIGSIALLASIGCSQYHTKTLRLRERADIEQPKDHKGIEINASIAFDSPDKVHLITSPENGIIGFGLNNAYYSLDFTDIDNIGEHFIFLNTPISDFGERFDPLTPRATAEFGEDLESFVSESCSFADTCNKENPLNYQLNKRRIAGTGKANLGSYEQKGNLEFVNQIVYEAEFDGRASINLTGENTNTIGELPITQSSSRTNAQLTGILDAEFNFKNSIQARAMQRNRTYSIGAGIEIGTTSKGTIHEEIDLSIDADTSISRSIHTNLLFDLRQKEISDTSKANFGVGILLTHLYPHYRFSLLSHTHSIHPEVYAQLGFGHTGWERKRKNSEETQHAQSSERLQDLLRNPDLALPLEEENLQDEKTVNTKGQITTPYALWTGFRLRPQRSFPAQLMPYGSIMHNGKTHGTLGGLLGITNPLPLVFDANYTYTLTKEVFETENPTLGLTIPVGISTGNMINYLATEKRLATSILAQDIEQHQHEREFFSRQQGGFIQLLYTDKERIGASLHAGHPGIGSFSSEFLSEHKTHSLDLTLRGPAAIPLYLGFGTSFKKDPQPKDNLRTEYQGNIGIDIPY